MKPALVLLAHGARNPAWAAPFEAVAAEIRRERPDLTVHLAFLELMPPDLPTVLRSLATEGVTAVDLMPMFLGGTGHVMRDVPPLLEAARQDLGLRITLHTALGQQPSMVAAMAGTCLALLKEPTP